MKKFLLLLNKEMLTPQLWVPFLAVIVVFLVIGNVAGKQVQKQSTTKESIAIMDEDSSSLSTSSIQAIGQIAEVRHISSTDEIGFVTQMKNEGASVGIIFPVGFEQQASSSAKPNLKTYALINNFSVLAGKRFGILTASTQAVNEVVSQTLAGSSANLAALEKLKNPVTTESFVSSKNIILPGDPNQVLAYVMGQTTFIPIILFVVIIMAAQMIASAVATEKENKTLETLLSLPISRKTIVAAKMLSAGLVSLVMAGLYMLGIRSFNTGLSGLAGAPSTSASGNVGETVQALGLKLSGIGTVELGIVLFLAILLALAIAMILGAFSEDAKSAQGVVAPLMILVMIPYFLTLFMDVSALSTPVKALVYAIPFSHIFLATPNILLGNDLAVLYGAIYLLALFIVSILVAAKIFSSDLILTMKLNFSKKKK